jgi:hypothetical protein
VDRFLSQAEEILDIAASSHSSMEAVILIDRLGGMRMMEASGWSLPALTAEYGATAVFRIERRSTGVRVEGWNGSQRCLLERTPPARILNQLPGMAMLPQAVMLQVRSGVAA